MVEGYAIDGPQAPSNAQSFFENGPMIDFKIAHERKAAACEEISRVSFENGLMIDFQEKNDSTKK